MRRTLYLSAVLATLSGGGVLAQSNAVQMLGLRGNIPGRPDAFSSNAVTKQAAKPARHYLPTNAQEVSTAFIGSVIFPENVSGTWLYRTDKWAPERLAMNVVANAGGFAVDDIYYLTRIEEVMGITAIQTVSYKMDDNWAVDDQYTGKMNYAATTIAYSPERDQAYGCFLNEEGTGYTFTRWRYSYFQPDRVIRTLDRPWSGCTFDRTGVLYAIERNGDLYTVKLSDGEMTKIGNTGKESNYQSDCTWDPATGKIIWCVNTDTEYALYSVDPKTAAATKLYDLQNGEQICGMAVRDAKAPADAPAKIYSVSLSFSGTAMAGKVSFSMPSQTVGGTKLPADQNLNWAIRANGKEIATGEALPGTRVNQDVTMTESDWYNFEATTSNNAGTSPRAHAGKFVGIDTPKPLSTLNATVKGNVITLQWGSVNSTGIDGGSIPTSQAKYTVVRYPDNKVIADQVTTRTATDEIDMPATRTEYYYEVKVTVGDRVSDPTRSGKVAFGPIVPPYSSDFSTALELAGWQMADENQDNSTWNWYGGDKLLRISGSKGYNDWAITPAIVVKKGFTYPVTLSLYTTNYAEETFEVKAGTTATAEGMTLQVVPSTTLKNNQAQEYKGEFTAEADGMMYVGIHAATAEKSNAIYVNGLSIGEGINSNAPGAPTDVEISAPTDGTAEVNISFKAPVKTLGNKDLTGDVALSKIEIKRDAQVVKSFSEGLTAGAALTFKDVEGLTLGQHKYSIVAYNGYGAGTAVEKEVLVGAHQPVAPASALMVEEGNTGKVKITWAPVTEDVDGNTIKAEAVTYRVIDRQYNTIADNLSATEFEYQAVQAGEQAFVQFAVYAKTAGGESEKMAATAYKAVGKPSVAPWEESFADKTIHSPFGYNYIKGQQPWIFTNSCDFGITPQDGDGGFAYFEAYSVYTALVTGKIDLGEIDSPALTYYVFNYGNTPRTNSIDIQVDNGDGQGFRSVKETVVSSSGDFGKWNKVLVDLSDFAAQTIAIRIEPKNADLAFYAIDNMRIASHVERNLTATRLNVPGVVDADKEFELEFSYMNSGENAINSYTVELWRDGEMIASKDGAAIQPAAVKTVNFSDKLGILDKEEANYVALINCKSDMVERDNATDTVKVSVNDGNLPMPRNLSGALEGERLRLTWQAPDPSTAAPARTTETFEDATSWSQEVSGWKMVDADQTPVGGIQINKFPITGTCSWFVADYTWDVFHQMSEGAERWSAHSGNKFIASSYVMFAGSPVQSDDWAISPRLYGGRHAISFYAKSFDPEYQEDFEVLYSKETSNPEDFQSIGKVVSVPSSWTQYRYMLPEGARFFAIRSRSCDKFFLFVDDASFIPADGKAQTAEVVGYNLYRDNEKVNDQPITGTSYLDATAKPEDKPGYMLTAVYADGESRPTAKYVFDFNGLNSFVADGVAVSSADGSIIVSGANGMTVNVSSIDGRTVARVAGMDVNRISVAAGIYIVKAGRKTVKVIVR